MTSPVGFQVTYDVDAKHFAALLADLTLKVSPPGLATFLNTTVDPFIRARIDARFSGEGDEVVGSWHPLTQATQAIRASQGLPPDHPINVRHGKMKHFLTQSKMDVKPSGFDAVGIHPPPTGDKEMQEKIVTAQMGRNSPRTPPRPVLGVNENDLLFITSELVVYLTAGLIP